MTARAGLQFLTVALIWGTTWIVIKFQLGTVNPSWSVAYRFAIGGVALLAWCLWKGLPLGVPRASLGFLTVLGCFQFVLNFNFVYRSEYHVPSGIPAVAFALLMVPNAILAGIFLGRRLSGRFLVGAGMGILGVGLLFWQQLELPGDRASTMLGLGLVIAGVLSASVGNVMQASRKALSFPPVSGLAWAMLIGAGVNAAAAAIFAGPPQWSSDWHYWGGLLYLGVFASAVAFALYFDLIRQIGPAEASWTGIPAPIIAMAISTLVEGYRWTPTAAAGALLAIAGLVVALSPERRRAAFEA